MPTAPGIFGISHKNAATPLPDPTSSSPKKGETAEAASGLDAARKKRQTETPEPSEAKEARTGNVPELRHAEVHPEEPAAQRQRGEPDEAVTGMFVVSSHSPKAPNQVSFAEDHEQIGTAAGDSQSRGQAGVEDKRDDDDDEGD